MTIARVSPHRKARRRTSAERKRANPERYCAENRCYRAPLHIGRCTTHAKVHLHKLVRSIVVGERTDCEAAEWHRDIFPCGGEMQVNHIIEREYLLTTWDLRNVIRGCRDLNLWAKRHPHEWARMVKDWRGEALYDELERISISGEKVDYEEALRALEEA